MGGGIESISDWTERHRPQTSADLLGNDAARKRIESWLQSWQKGTPEKRGLLLTGPPGIGKTSVVNAIANDLGWVVVELNASDSRNAAAIRKVAGGGSNFSFGLDGSFDFSGNSKTLILLDEVDHLHGGLRAVSENRIGDTLAQTRGEEGRHQRLSGDSGGKAELVRMLKSTQQPILMTCNEPMGLWGRRNKNWRSTRDRFLRLAELVQFRRATQEDLLSIANTILKKESVGVDRGALLRLVSANPGDIRALVRDLQMIVEVGCDHIDLEQVEAQLSRGLRDQQLDLFPGLEELYRCGSSFEAVRLSRELEITPRELVAWVSWNNSSIFRGRSALHKSAVTCSHADTALSVMFRNNAYRSWYWSGNLSALSAAVTTELSAESRISLSYPAFLRRGREPWQRGSLIEKLAALSASSKAAAREELWPPLIALHEGDGAPPVHDFSLSMELDLDGSEHVLLHGLKKNLKSTKELVEKYEEMRYSTLQVEPIKQEVSDTGSETKSLPQGQKKLEFF